MFNEEPFLTNEFTTVVIPEEECNKLQTAYYEKLGLETIAKESNDISDDMLIRLGKAVEKFNIEGNKIILKYFANGDNDFINKLKSWSCDFTTRKFEIVKK